MGLFACWRLFARRPAEARWLRPLPHARQGALPSQCACPATRKRRRRSLTPALPPYMQKPSSKTGHALFEPTLAPCTQHGAGCQQLLHAAFEVRHAHRLARRLQTRHIIDPVPPPSSALDHSRGVHGPVCIRQCRGPCAGRVASGAPSGPSLLLGHEQPRLFRCGRGALCATASQTSQRQYASSLTPTRPWQTCRPGRCWRRGAGDAMRLSLQRRAPPARARRCPTCF